MNRYIYGRPFRIRYIVGHEFVSDIFETYAKSDPDPYVLYSDYLIRHIINEWAFSNAPTVGQGPTTENSPL